MTVRDTMDPNIMMKVHRLLLIGKMSVLLMQSSHVLFAPWFKFIYKCFYDELLINDLKSHGLVAAHPDKYHRFSRVGTAHLSSYL